MKKDSHSHNGQQAGDREYHPCHDSNELVECNVDMSEIGPGTEKEPLVYDVTDRPPIYLTIIFAFQQALSSLPTALTVSLFVAEAACASDFHDIRTYLLSSTLFMSGLTTLLMVTVGVRLPLYQGPVAGYVIPLLTLKMIDKNVCLVKEDAFPSNTSLELANVTSTAQRELSMIKLREFQGSLILAGIIHFLIGATGAVGFLLRYIGPVTLVPTILLGCIYICMASAKFAGCHWGVSMFTAAVSIALSLYLGHKNLPIPFMSREKGFHIVWMPLHQMFAILIGMIAGWIMSAVLTYTGMLTDDKDHYEYLARTDANPMIVRDANWFNFPYPNKFGTPLFNTGVFVAFMITTVLSVLDSVGDYYACARVASRDMFVCLALVYMLFGIVGKVSAVFLAIPYPVLGGAIIVLYGMFNGIILSNLQHISLSSTRNISIIGIALLMGLMVPQWIEDEPNAINTGDAYYDNIIRMLLVNPNLCGGLLAFFLDNTVPGTRHERGIDVWSMSTKGKGDNSSSEEELAIYNPLFPRKWLTASICRFIPFCPDLQPTVVDTVDEYA